MTNKVLEINCETGKEILRDMTSEELAQQAKDKVAADLFDAEIAIQENKRATAQAKLAALGLTADDLKALGL